MSLLIKALASAEREKGKAKASANTEPLTEDGLALMPIEPSVSIAVDDVLRDENLSGEVAVLAGGNSEEMAFDDAGLSLAEEAGLLVRPDSKLRNNGNAKPKLASNAAKSKSKADAFNEAAMASVAQVKEQAKATRDRQKAAASVFVANHAAKTTSSRSALMLLGVAGALIILLGLQGYQYFQSLFADEVIIVKPVAPPIPASEVQATDAGVVSGEVPASGDVEGSEVVTPVDALANSKENEVSQLSQSSPVVAKPALEKQVPVAKADARVMSDATVEDEPRLPPQKSAVVSARKSAQVDEAGQRERQVSEAKEPLKLVSKTAVAGVDPTLQAAYEAFSRGDDASAQQKYRLVLQKDVRNIDALLGMAAIAQRQDRNMDAIGWYRKVIEVEPRNSIAQSALANLEASTDGVGAESKIKSMLARQPDAANLHAALGNLYAAQNQWASAQAAYFNASQYAPISADYAFNLAISLEHLGKPKLALVQYQRALELLNMTGAASPDRAQLEARIRALQ